MFESVGNLPLHPLVLHAVVIGIPLALLASLFFALPRTRSWARLALPVVAVGALVATFVAKESGEALQRTLAASQQLEPGTPTAVLIQAHAHLAGQLMLIMVGVAVLALVNAVVVGRVGGTPERRGSRGRDVVLVALLVASALVASFWVYRVGDVGARAVWNPTGDANYSSSTR